MLMSAVLSDPSDMQDDDLLKLMGKLTAQSLIAPKLDLLLSIPRLREEANLIEALAHMLHDAFCGTYPDRAAEVCDLDLSTFVPAADLLAQHGKRIYAIRALRDVLPLNLTEAKNLTLVAVPIPLAPDAQTYTGAVPEAETRSADDVYDDQLLLADKIRDEFVRVAGSFFGEDAPHLDPFMMPAKHLMDNHRIDAIKVLRNTFAGLSLKEAKTIVDYAQPGPYRGR